MQKIIILLICVALFSLFQSVSGQGKNPFKEAVDAQKQLDQKNRKELIEKMHALIGGFNKRLKDAGVKGADLSSPVSDKDVNGIKETTEYHSNAPEKKVTAYAKDKIEIYDAPETRIVVGSVVKGEELEILGKSEERSEFKGINGRWFIARKQNQNEGWIHSSYLAKDKPGKEPTAPPDKKAQESAAPSKKGDGGFDLPVNGRRTSNYGYRVDPFSKKQTAFHSGIDIAAPAGTPVSTSQDGVVRSASFTKGGYGNLIVVEHAKDFATYYGHLSRINTRQGAQVKKGQNIGAVGSTGASTGPHLHFEVRRSEKALDPDAYIR